MSEAFLVKNIDVVRDFIIREWKGTAVFFWEPFLNRVILTLILLVLPVNKTTIFKNVAENLMKVVSGPYCEVE